MDRNPRHAIIFGGSGAIGSAAAAAIARSGATLTLAARNASALETSASPLRAQGSRVKTAAVDVFDAAALERAVTDAVDTAGPLDAVVIAVSFAHDQGTLLADLDIETFMTPVDRFMRAHFLIARAVAPRLAVGATVICLSTPIAKMTAPGHLGYATACAGVEAFSRNLSHELAAAGGRSVCVRPHAISDAPAAGSYTRELFALKAAAIGLSVEDWLDGAAAGTMTGALPRLAEVGDVIAFLASGRAPSFAGNVIDLTAGMLVS